MFGGTSQDEWCVQNGMIKEDGSPVHFNAPFCFRFEVANSGGIPIGLAPGTRFRTKISPEVLRFSGHFRSFFFNSKLNLKLLKVNFLEYNISESREAQKAKGLDMHSGLYR
jgi:hypothetical protein